MSEDKKNRPEERDSTVKTSVAVCPACNHWHLGSPEICENCGAPLASVDPSAPQDTKAEVPAEQPTPDKGSSNKKADLSSEFEISLPIETPDYSAAPMELDETIAEEEIEEEEESQSRSLEDLLEEIPDIRKNPQLATSDSSTMAGKTVQDVPLPADSMLSVAVPYVVRVSATKQWRELLRDWQNDQRHKTFVQTLVSQGGVELAAIAYKNYLLLHPKDEQATKWKEKLAMQAVMLVAPDYLGKTTNPKEIQVTPFIVFVLIAGIGALTALMTYLILLFPEWLK